MKYWMYEEDKLDLMLEKVWLSTYKDLDKDYESDLEDQNVMSLMYSANTMEDFYYSWNHILRKRHCLFNIIIPSSLSFKQSK